MYAKVFSQIFDSSIVEKPEVRFTFMDLLVLADADGVVDMTHEAIARRTNRPIEVIRETIAELEAPDPNSRTPDALGARLKRLDAHRTWGWVIVNFDRFRRTETDDQRREKNRERVRKYRAKLREKPQCNADVTPCSAMLRMSRQAEAEAEAYTDKGASASTPPAVPVEPGPDAPPEAEPRPKPEPAPVVFPPGFDVPEFQSAWAEWLEHRRQKRKPMTPLSTRKQLNALAKMGVPRAIAAINHSIAQGWQGIFEENSNVTDGKRSDGRGQVAKAPNPEGGYRQPDLRL